MRMDGMLPPLGQSLGLIEETVSTTGSRGQKVNWNMRQETLLAVYRASRGLLIQKYREAVRTLKCPIRGIDTRQSIRWIHATSMME
jgi:hypothetical protein